MPPSSPSSLSTSSEPAPSPSSLSPSSSNAHLAQGMSAAQLTKFPLRALPKSVFDNPQSSFQNFLRSSRAVVVSAMCAHAIRAAALVLALCPARCAPDLEHLAFHFGTDKSHDDHKYTDLYAMLFAPLRNTAQNITEIGIAAGQSLWLWNDYFPHAHIWGIDIAPNQLRQQRPAFTANAPRVHLLLGDVTNPSEVESFGFSPESMDVIIDDGPHSSGPNERILVNMWPYLKLGGYYCVEDIQTGIDDMAATQSTASGAGVPGKPGWAYLAHGAAEGRMGEQARQILQEHSAGPTLSLNP